MSKRFTHNGIVIVDHLKKDLIHIDGDENLLDLAEYVDRLQYENEQLKQQLYDCKKDKKQLGISFMEFKMQLIEVLQQNYNYAYNQRQKNLDDVRIAYAYDVLRGTVKGIADDMGVDLE